MPLFRRGGRRDMGEERWEKRDGRRERKKKQKQNVDAPRRQCRAFCFVSDMLEVVFN